MRALVEHDDDVAGGDAGDLVALAGEDDLLAVDHALVDVDLEHLLVLHDLAALAVLAAVVRVKDLALALALLAGRLDLLDHAGADLPKLHRDAVAVARPARPAG